MTYRDLRVNNIGSSELVMQNFEALIDGTKTLTGLNVVGNVSITGNENITGSLSLGAGIHINGGNNSTFFHIEVSSPSNTAQIHFDQGASLDTYFGPTNSDTVDLWSFQNIPFRIGLNNAELFRLTSAGKIGIGIAAPSTTVHVYNATGSAVIRATNASATCSIDITASGGGAGFVSVPTNHPLVFETNNTERMRILADGGLGVGVNSLTANYFLQLPNSSSKKALANAWDTYACSQKWKTEITPIQNAIEKLKSISGIKFKYNYDDKNHILNGKYAIGITAEDLDKIELPGLVSKHDDDEYASINLVNLIPILLQAIKELNVRLDKLEE